jgi:hypothetical protein
VPIGGLGRGLVPFGMLAAAATTERVRSDA